MSKEKPEKRKSIFVSKETYERFKKLANADDRKYEAYLNMLMDAHEAKK